MATAKLRALIGYVVSRLEEMEATFGKTKLVKLLYLADVENYRRYGQKLSELDWVFYHYGPYALEIDQALREIELDIPQEEVTTANGHRAVVFRPSRHVETDFEKQVSSREKMVVDRVLKQWGLEELNPLLSYVYFYTEPMKDAKRGEPLDFAKIAPPLPPKTPSHATRSSEAHINALRSAFAKARAGHTRQVCQPLDPKPRIDEVFWHGLTNLHKDEHYSVPAGPVDIAEGSKENLRQQSGTKK